MAIRPKDIYQGRKKSRSRAGVIIVVILAVLTALVLIFYGLRNYAVYDENGNATIILPFSHETDTESPAPSTGESPPASPSESVSPSPSSSPGTGPSQGANAERE
ncbi:MAG: hypothetical protein VB064_10520 [Oscillospiraceae bacterium]|nr:hypothetical protein [Oscillospiraceae bacterium]